MKRRYRVKNKQVGKPDRQTDRQTTMAHQPKLLLMIFIYRSSCHLCYEAKLEHETILLFENVEWIAFEVI